MALFTFNKKKKKKEKKIRNIYVDRFIYVYLIIFIFLCLLLRLKTIFIIVLSILFVGLILGTYFIKYKVKTSIFMSDERRKMIDEMETDTLTNIMTKYYQELRI